MKPIKNYLSLVKFSHTIFAMPFALIGFFLAIPQASLSGGSVQEVPGTMGLVPTLRIDYIFANPKWEVTQCATVPSNYSDHLPVVADLQLLK